jgi:hypothetical protein
MKVNKPKTLIIAECKRNIDNLYTKDRIYRLSSHVVALPRRHIFIKPEYKIAIHRNPIPEDEHCSEYTYSNIEEFLSDWKVIKLIEN